VPVALTMDGVPVPCISPHGDLVLQAGESGEMIQLPQEFAERMARVFQRGAGHALLELGSREISSILPPVYGFWRDLAVRFITTVCTSSETPSTGSATWAVAPDEATLQEIIWTAPPMRGAEYLTSTVLGALWGAARTALCEDLAASGLGLQDFLRARHPSWNLIGRVHVHLAENRSDVDAPFAFLATYTTRLSRMAKAQHQPLGQALSEFSQAKDQQKLLSLLSPLQKAAERCAWLKDHIESRAIFHPLRWSASAALQFLNDVPVLEAAGIIVRMPATWRANRPSRVRVQVSVGGREPSLLGQEAMLDFAIGIALEGKALTQKEVRELLRSTQGLVLIRGSWVEIDPKRLRATMAHFQEVERTAAATGLDFHAAMRLLAGVQEGSAEEPVAGEQPWSEVVAGPWLSGMLAALRGPDGLAQIEPGAQLRATLRPYQQVGLRWLHLLSQLRLGACLADDMGLGKTIQVISLLLVRKQRETTYPSLLVVPASLLANWAQEIERFAPKLRVLIAHQSFTAGMDLATVPRAELLDYDVVITSYGTLRRWSWLTDTTWRLVVLDEAQAIKNPGTRQTRLAKSLKAASRIALTGTPIENRLGDLWSIFDFINPGLLGSAKAFTAATRRMADDARGFGPLRDLVRPYILRRLKTDKRVIADLPDKTEMNAYCSLSPAQAMLYQKAVVNLSESLASSDGIQRKGLVLSYLMRFKQICNHPSHWLGDGSWAEADSGKFARLRELVEVINAKQEKVLVFSQFREVTEPLAVFLGGIFGRPGLVLHGQTAIAKRKDLVRRFQEDETIPFLMLSLKAGGSGLNLTAAAHVIHFDRWWNPAVENQATDRAFRIGQTKNVLVHKFICRGTIEEKIDALIASKRQLADDILDGTQAELKLTELSDAQLLDLVRLDLSSAGRED